MSEHQTTDGGPVAVPLVELLRSIPEDARLKVEDGWKSSTVWPVGLLVRQAADEIERLRAGLVRIRDKCDWEWAARVAQETLDG